MILRELAERLACEWLGDGDVEVLRVAGFDEAGPGDLSFVAQPRYAARIDSSGAAALVVRPGVVARVPCILSANPYLTFARAVDVLQPRARLEPGVHPSASVDPTARLGDSVHVGPFAVVGARACVGPRCVLHAHVVVYPGARIGADCLLHAGVHVREDCRVGDRVVLQNGAVIGADGFGFAKDDQGRYHKIPQVGVVVIEDDVEVGALATIDRASTGETRIASGVKLDNLVHIGHSVRIGRDTVMAAQVGVAGSVRIGERVMLGGQVGINGHVEIGDGATAFAKTGISSSLPAGAVVGGYPHMDARTWRRAVALVARLPELSRRLRRIEAALEGLGLREADARPEERSD